jgi:mono/diheme cytochrome c family protein
MNRTTRSIGGMVACLALAANLLARPSTTDDDDPEALALQGRLAFENNCLMCHGAPIIESQRLTPEQWKASLAKMIDWGAPVPIEDREALLALLNARYGENVPPAKPGRITIAEAEASLGVHPAGSPTDAHVRGAELFALQCASCHGADARGSQVGTNLVEKPVLDRGDDFRRIVREGRRRMPGFKQSLDPSAEDALIGWLRRK